MTGVDTALLILRLAAGILLIGHGLQKSLGWFSGDGLARTARIFEKVGYRPGRPMAVIAATMEISTGLGVAAGLATPLAAAGMVGTMIVAASVTWRNGLWATRMGYELPLLYAVVAAAIGFGGAGRFSLDAALGWYRIPGWTGWAAVALGVVAAVPVVLRRVPSGG